MEEHRAIRQELLRRGLFETRMGYYYLKLVCYAALFAGAIALTLWSGSTWGRMAGAALLAAYWQQLAFFGHDIGHNAVSHERSKDLWRGIVLGNTTGGIALGWWKRSHNVHHVVCNSVENDPDIQHLPVMAVDSTLFRKYWSTYHEKWISVDAVARFLVSWQHVLFYPIMAVARFNLYAQSYILLLSKERKNADMKHWKLELACLVAFAVWFTMLVASLPSWGERVAYLLLSHGLAGLLHVQICLSRKVTCIPFPTHTLTLCCTLQPCNSVMQHPDTSVVERACCVHTIAPIQ